MTGLLLALFLLQASPQNSGAVTGVVRGANGMPAPGVRVYAIAVRETAEPANAGTALEGQAQTDAAGRYRLEVAAGRYYIASGSVGAPTYFPGTTNLADARVISVARGGLVDNIDFSSFVPASRTLSGAVTSIPTLPPGSTGVLQGVLRFSDGAPAAGMTVLAIPAAVIAGNTVTASATIRLRSPTGTMGTATRLIINGHNIIGGYTDRGGVYRLENLPPETYYIAAGFSDRPIFFPGTADILVAKTFTTTPTTLLTSLDFSMPGEAAGVSVSGRVTALGGAPAAGTTVQLVARTPPILPSAFSLFGLPSRILNTNVRVNPDGTFELPSVLPGDYSVVASAAGVPGSVDLTVSDQPVKGLELAIAVAVLSGRILMEDGSPVPNPWVFTDAIVTTVNNPNIVGTTMLAIANDGTFSRVIEADDYRFYLRNLPDDYIVKSMTSGTQDLLKETLKVPSTDSTNIEIRVAARTGTLANETKVSGNVIDSITGLPVSAERVVLCCLSSGPAERFSTPLRADGSFEFAGVPRGRYTVELQTGAGQPRLYVAAPDLEVANEPVTGRTVFATPQLRQLFATLSFESGNPFPANAPPLVVFTAASGRVRVTAQRNSEGYVASVPAGDRYDISIANLPEGYAIKSISGSTSVPPPQGTLPAILTTSAPMSVTITIGPSTPR
jgi:hypothetical protein